MSTSQKPNRAERIAAARATRTSQQTAQPEGALSDDRQPQPTHDNQRKGLRRLQWEDRPLERPPLRLFLLFALSVVGLMIWAFLSG